MESNNKKILGLIGLAARSRKICFGADSVEEKIKRSNVKVIIIAIDASSRTKEKFKNLCKQYQIPIIILEEQIEVLSKAIGKTNKAVVGIEEPNLANQICKINNGGEIIG